ncbi:hypothetical protein M2333_001583 [Sphingobium sp. B11D3B]|uniref:hypothetical protein n=1 Tax=Sphingobium sp. B11D3B TaxID=2940575 RepID=UPI00222762E1|nr:hypothetical protein [Sphingobium sp. B11D3B]MCW2388537.1 hypothetical protein [Sphingobium sp. B11D3B]
MPDSDFISEHEAAVITAKSPKLLKWFTSYSQRSDERKADFRESIFTIERRLCWRSRSYLCALAEFKGLKELCSAMGNGSRS